MEIDFAPNPDSPHLKENKKSLFLSEFPKHGTILKTAEAVNVHRSTINRWKNDDPQFRQAFLELDNEVTETLEEAAMQRALAGSDTLTIFLLKSRRPEVYRDNFNYTLEKEMSKFRNDLIGTVINVINRTITTCCPACGKDLEVRKKLADEFNQLAKKPLE